MGEEVLSTLFILMFHFPQNLKEVSAGVEGSHAIVALVVLKILGLN